MRTRLPIQVRYDRIDALGYRPDFDADPTLLDLAFEGAGFDLVTLVIQRMQEADAMMGVR